MDAENHKELRPLVEQLKSLWGMENAILKKMPAMMELSTDMGLKNIIRLHFAETLNQTSALRGIFKQLEVEPDGESIDSINTILSEVSSFSSILRGVDLDLKIIDVALRIERYEIEQYTTGVSLAEAQALHGIRKTLLVTLNEEKLSRVKLDFLKKNVKEHAAHLHEETLQG